MTPPSQASPPPQLWPLPSIELLVKSETVCSCPCLTCCIHAALVRRCACWSIPEASHWQSWCWTAQNGSQWNSRSQRCQGHPQRRTYPPHLVSSCWSVPGSSGTGQHTGALKWSHGSHMPGGWPPTLNNLRHKTISPFISSLRLLPHFPPFCFPPSWPVQRWEVWWSPPPGGPWTSELGHLQTGRYPGTADWTLTPTLQKIQKEKSTWRSCWNFTGVQAYILYMYSRAVPICTYISYHTSPILWLCVDVNTNTLPV